MSTSKASKRPCRRDQLAQELARVDGRFLPGTRSDRKKGLANPLKKHVKMAADPFRFFRGSAQLFYADMATGIISLPKEIAAQVLVTRITGDCHLANFGFFTEGGSHGDSVIFAPNDFDDACVGLACWDLIRFGVSLCLAAEFAQGVINGRYSSDKVEVVPEMRAVSVESAADAIGEFLRAYQQECLRIVDDPEHRLTALSKFDNKHILAKPAKKARDRAAGGRKFLKKSSLAKAIDLNRNQLKFKTNPERFQRLKQQTYNEIYREFCPYVDDHVLDIVQRLGAGTGSVNMERYYLLVGPEPGQLPHCYRGPQDLALCHLVEVKQQREAAPIFHFPQISPVNSLNPAHLTVDCQWRMQRRPDLVLDEKVWHNKHWLIRSRHHARVGIDPEDIVFTRTQLSDEITAKDSGLRQYAAACGAALALAHSRGDRRSTRFEQAMAEAIASCDADLVACCVSYTDTVCRDWQLLNELLS